MSSPLSFRQLDQWLSYLEGLHTKEIDLGLDRILLVYRRLKIKFPNSKVITVAGTNGKGTTIATLEAVLLAKDKNVATYTSPHIHVFNERIKINGQLVSDEALVEAFQAIETARKNVSLTYFEFTTLAALLHFSQQTGLDYVLLEVGLGGRLDAVNIVDPDVAIITSIGLDHTDWLGDTRDQIGFEKAGIFRVNGKAVVGEEDVPSSILQQAHAQHVNLKRVGHDFYYDHVRQEIVIVGSTTERDEKADSSYEIRIPYAETNIPISNQMAAIQALMMLEEPLPEENLAGVLSGVRVPGRLEQISSNPRVIVDVAHNVQAAKYLAKRIPELVIADEKVICVFSVMADKDIAGVQAELSSLVDEWVLFPLDMPRAANIDVMTDYLAAEKQPYQVAESAAKCIQDINAMALAYRNALFIVCGSFFTVAAIKENWVSK